MKLRSAAVAILSLAVACGCGSDTPLQPEPLPPGVTPSETPEREIHITDSGFSPSEVLVAKGTIVRWINDGPSIHSSRSDIGVWDSGEICSPSDASEAGCRGFGGVTYGRLFSHPGIFTYRCAAHPDKQGTVVVME